METLGDIHILNRYSK